MSRCTCNNPCTCFFEYDGDRTNTNYTLPYKYGRYSSQRSGSGTPADPYIIEFIDSEEFKVPAGQARNSQDQVIIQDPDGVGGGEKALINTIDYETPNEFFLFFETLSAGNVGIIAPSSHKFWFVTAEATFVNNQQSAGIRRIAIVYHPANVNFGDVGVEITVAGNTSSGLPGGSEDITLNCSGMAPFVNTTDPTDTAEFPGGYFYIDILQSSTQTMTVRNIKFTAVAI